MNRVRSVWETVVTCVHAHREIACTTNISITHEWILLQFEILLTDYQLNTLRSIWETFGTCLHCVHAQCRSAQPISLLLMNGFCRTRVRSTRVLTGSRKLFLSFRRYFFPCVMFIALDSMNRFCSNFNNRSLKPVSIEIQIHLHIYERVPYVLSS